MYIFFRTGKILKVKPDMHFILFYKIQKILQKVNHSISKSYSAKEQAQVMANMFASLIKNGWTNVFQKNKRFEWINVKMTEWKWKWEGAKSNRNEERHRSCQFCVILTSAWRTDQPTDRHDLL